LSQDYSRLKILATNQELSKLANLGVAIDHGIHKEDVFFISDFSKAERDIMDQYGFDYEVLIEDVQAYYIEQLDHTANKPENEQKNTNCSNSSGTSGYSPIIPTHFNLGTMGGYLKIRRNACRTRRDGGNISKFDYRQSSNFNVFNRSKQTTVPCAHI